MPPWVWRSPFSGICTSSRSFSILMGSLSTGGAGHVPRVPSGHVDPTAASVALTTSDGVALTADLAPADAPTGAAVLCHPHPRFGGNRLNAVVAALFRALPAAGITALRFDFRRGAGADGGDLAGERLDVGRRAGRAAARRVPTGRCSSSATRSAPASRSASRTPPWPLPSPSLPRWPSCPCAARRTVPTLVLVPALDQYSPPAVVEPLVADWPAVTVETVDGADHFLVGHAATVAARAAEWLTR